jgi:hypothetical protein
MPSPFPGMDPYLEDPVFWAGFHANLNPRIQAALNRMLPAGYYADIDEYVWLQTDEPESRARLGRPDVFVTDRNGAGAPGNGGGVAVLAEPVLVTLPKAKKRAHKYVKIVAPDHATVVTVIEVLSPASKASAEDRAKYLAKRAEYFASNTHLVELDLLRGGPRMPLGEPSPPDDDYYVFVCRGGRYPNAEVYPFGVRDRFPVFPVPLGGDEPDLPLDLKPCVDDIYDTNRYATRVDYAKPVAPRFRKGDAVWVTDLLSKHAKKKKK